MEMSKIVCEKTINGVTRTITATTPTGNQGLYVKSIVGIGNKFWLWPTISVPEGQKVVGADFTNAPTCSSDVAANNAAIAAITATPEEVLYFGPV